MRLPLLSLSFAAVATAALAADYYVATTGDDTGPGSDTTPWRTIQKAADTLQPGDTAWVREGVYAERVTVNVSGTPEHPVTLRAALGEHPIIDGSGLVPPANRDTALVLIKNRTFVRVQGFEIRRYRATSGNRVPCGILVIGECENIELRGNDIHCKLGNSESLTINGNVANFEVTNNRVHDNNNIGIVFIGFENSCPDPAQDFARDGLCRENTVWNISSYGNPAYGKEYSAGGIYVDGGARILIERNVTHDNDIGIELASEHRNRATREISVRDNLVYRNRIGGLFLGGYDAKRGGAEACVIRHNSFFENDTRRDGNGELYIHHYAGENIVSHNIFSAGRQSLLIGNPSTTGSANLLDYNLYFAPAGAEDSMWQWERHARSGFDAYRKLSGQDAHSVFADPRFVDIGAFNLRLLQDSAAIDRGDPAFLPDFNELDAFGEPRATGGRVDIGADEY